VAFGVTLAAVSSLALLVLLAGAQTDSGFSAGLHGAALRAAYQTRPGALTLAVVGTLVLAAPLLLLGRARSLALVPLAAAAILTSARGHAGTSGHCWAPAVESIHLLAVAAWIGALVHLALVLVRAPDRSTSAGAAIRRYSRLALPTVIVVLASGVLSGRMVAEVREIWKDWSEFGFYKRLLAPGRAERSEAVVEAMRPIALQHGVSVAQLALAWVLAQGDDIVPIPGTKRVRYLEENVAAAEIELSAEDLRRLDEAFPKGATVGDRYPDMTRVNIEAPPARAFSR